MELFRGDKQHRMQFIPAWFSSLPEPGIFAKSVDLEFSSKADQDVRGIEIKVQDPLTMSMLQGGKHGPDPALDLVLILIPPELTQDLAKTLAFHEFAHHIDPALILKQTQGLADIGMFQAQAGFGLQPELAGEFSIADVALLVGLDGYKGTAEVVFRLVNAMQACAIKSFEDGIGVLALIGVHLSAR